MDSKKPNLVEWFKGGDPWIWVNAAAVSVSIIAVLGLLFVLAVNGFGHFWPSKVLEAKYQPPGQEQAVLIQGEVADKVSVSAEQLISAGINVEQGEHGRWLIKKGNKDVTGADFGWIISTYLSEQSYPEDIMVLERYEWGNFYGRLIEVYEGSELVASVGNDGQDATWNAFMQRLDRTSDIHDQIYDIEKKDIGAINYGMERLRLRTRRVELDGLEGAEKAEALADIAAERAELDAEYEVLQRQLEALYQKINRDSIKAVVVDGRTLDIPIAKIVHAIQPNKMSIPQKIGAYY